MRISIALCALSLLFAGCRTDEAQPCGAGSCPAGEACEQGSCVPAAGDDEVAIVSFTATPPAISRGLASALSWSTANAAACSLAPALGLVPRNDSVEVRPEETTTYTLTCEGLGGPKEGEVTVQVLADAGAPDDSGPVEPDAGGRPDAGERYDDAGPGEADAGPAGEEDAGFDAGPPVVPCETLYGEAAGYVLCADTPSTCEFTASTAAYEPATCRTVCAAFGGECLQAFDDQAACEVMGEDDCDTVRSTEVCVCSR